MRTIAIIGSGPTAIYALRHILPQGEPLAITLFEAQAQAGKGTPYHQDWNDSQMLANIASIELPPVTETLVHWLEGRTDEELASLGIMRDAIDERAFFPRVALGNYFHDQLKKLVHNASAYGSRVTVKTLHKVLDVRVVEQGVRLAVCNQEHIQHPVFDYVIMATGHAWPKKSEIRPGYFLSPWPAAALATIKNGHVGIRGASLSAIDALVALSVARGVFERNLNGELEYWPEPGTEKFHITLMSRKGLLPEADFYHPVPYTPLHICTAEAVDRLIALAPRNQLLNAVFSLFKAELAHCDPAYAALIGLVNLTLEQFPAVYFKDREEHDPFVWAELNLKEAKANRQQRYTVAWRYAILRMHEVIGRVVPALLAEDFKRFNSHFKHVFVDDYATVPHESIERLLALRRAGKLDIIKLGEDYTLDTESVASGAVLIKGKSRIHFSAFIEAMGQRTLSVHEFPFASLWEQGIVQKATAAYSTYPRSSQARADIGGIALDKAFHPICNYASAARLYCLSLPFMLGQFPFAQGITSSNDMGRKVAEDIIKQFQEDNVNDKEEDRKIFAAV